MGVSVDHMFADMGGVGDVLGVGRSDVKGVGAFSQRGSISLGGVM